MQNGKQEKTGKESQDKAHAYVTCQMCGRKIEPKGCNWQDDDGTIYCRDCKAERESCGCSD